MIFSNLIYILLFMLFFFLPIPHTISIREILFATIITMSVIATYYKKEQPKYLFKDKLFYILSILTVYIFLHSIFLSVDTSWSLQEFLSQWIMPILYLILGTNIAYLTIQKNSLISEKTIITLLFYSMFFHVLYIDIVALKTLITDNYLLTRYGGLTQHPVMMNYITNLLLALICAEIINRYKNKKTAIYLSNLLLLLVLILTIFSSLIESMRNGSVAMFFLGFSTGFFLIIKNEYISKTQKIAIIVLTILILSIPILYNLKSDKRWNSLIQTIPIALDTTHNKAWLDNTLYPYPNLSNNTPISISNYERIAWVYESLKLIYENPLGIGFGRTAFGHALQLKYGGEGGGKHSHSGILDFTIGTGLIGLGLLIWFIYYLLRLSFKQILETFDFNAMVVFFLTTGFFTRSLVDSNIRDHIFLQYILLLGIFFIFMKNNNEKSISH